MPRIDVAVGFVRAIFLKRLCFSCRALRQPGSFDYYCGKRSKYLPGGLSKGRIAAGSVSGIDAAPAALSLSPYRFTDRGGISAMPSFLPA